MLDISPRILTGTVGIHYVITLLKHNVKFMVGQSII